MRHEAGVDVLECPCVNELDLATTTLLGRRAQCADTSRELEVLEEGNSGEKACKRPCRDDVVPASMADAGESVVLDIEDYEAAT